MFTGFVAVERTGNRLLIDPAEAPGEGAKKRYTAFRPIRSPPLRPGPQP